MTKAHSELGASSADRWMTCPGSVSLSRGMPNVSSTYAQEGTAAHAVAELCLQQGMDAIELVGRVVEGFEVDEEMAEAVQVYLDGVRADIGPGDVMLVEEKFDLSHLFRGMFGTNDSCVYKPHDLELIVNDYKHGRGIPVEAYQNPQMMYYAIGALTGNNARKIKKVTLRIYQPRCNHPDGPVRSWTVSVVELLEFAGELVEAAKRTEAATPEFVAGEHCRFCPAAGVCKELEKQALAAAKADFTEAGEVIVSAPQTYKPEDLANILKNAHVIEHWLTSVRSFAYAEAIAGNEIPGFKLVPTRPMRRWKDEGATIDALRDMGVPDKDLYNRKVKSPAQAEKLFKKKDYHLLEDLYEKVSSGTVLVSEDDKRERAKSDAGSEFA